MKIVNDPVKDRWYRVVETDLLDNRKPWLVGLRVRFIGPTHQHGNSHVSGDIVFDGRHKVKSRFGWNLPSLLAYTIKVEEI